MKCQNILYMKQSIRLTKAQIKAQVSFFRFPDPSLCFVGQLMDQPLKEISFLADTKRPKSKLMNECVKKLQRSYRRWCIRKEVHICKKKKVDPDDPYASRHYAQNFFPISAYSELQEEQVSEKNIVALKFLTEEEKFISQLGTEISFGNLELLYNNCKELTFGKEDNFDEYHLRLFKYKQDIIVCWRQGREKVYHIIMIEQSRLIPSEHAKLIRRYRKDIIYDQMKIDMGQIIIEPKSREEQELMFAKLNEIEDERLKTKGYDSDSSLIYGEQMVSSGRVFTGKDIKNVIQIQKHYRCIRDRKWFAMMLKRMNELKSKNRGKGSIVSRHYLRYNQVVPESNNNEIVIALIYRKSKFTYEELFIEILQRLRRRNKSKFKMQGTIQVEKEKTLSTGTKGFYDQVLDRIHLWEGNLRLKQKDVEHFVILTDLNEFDEIRSKQAEILDSVDNSVKVVESEKPTNIEAANDSQQLLKRVEDRNESEQKLVFNHQELEDDTPLLYNVVYSGVKPLRSTNTRNQLNLSVNLRGVRRYYPTLNQNDKTIMKSIGEQLVQGISLTKGQVVIDRTKINPNFVKLEYSQLNTTVDTSLNRSFQSSHRRNHSNVRVSSKQRRSRKEVLIKTISYFQGTKYLISVSYDEKNIEKILKPSMDDTFFQFEAYYEITASVLSKQILNPITWTLTPEETNALCSQKDRYDIARYFLKRIQILGDHFLFLLDKKSDILKLKAQRHVVLLHQAQVVSIQMLFKRRKIYYAYKLFRDNLKLWKNRNYRFGKHEDYNKWRMFNPGVYQYEISKFNSNTEFIVIIGESREVKFQFVAWKLGTFERYSKEIPRQIYTEFGSDRVKKKILAGLLITQFLTYLELDDVFEFQLPKQKDLLDQIDEIAYYEKEQKILELAEKLSI